MERKMDIIDDFNGRKIVFIHDIIFKKKQYVAWKDVKEYLKKYVGEVYTIMDTKDMVYIGKDLPDEYTHSNYTNILKGANVKAKANATQGLPEMLLIANEKEYEENRKVKHSKDAKYGWYRYDSYFAIPVHASDGEVDYYNVFHASLLIRHSEDGKKYLYDIIDIKKETSYPLEP